MAAGWYRCEWTIRARPTAPRCCGWRLTCRRSGIFSVQLLLTKSRAGLPSSGAKTASHKDWPRTRRRPRTHEQEQGRDSYEHYPAAGDVRICLAISRRRRAIADAAIDLAEHAAAGADFTQFALAKPGRDAAWPVQPAGPVTVAEPVTISGAQH